MTTEHHTTAACIDVGPEVLITTKGTIIPQATHFAGGTRLLTFSVGRDGFGEPSGCLRHCGNGESWHDVALPLHRVSACGITGVNRALFFDQYLFSQGNDIYQAFFTETLDGGKSFQAVERATFHVPGLIPQTYIPKPASPYSPPVPPWYKEQVGKNELVIGAHLFGRILRLADGGLAMSCYGVEKTGLVQRKGTSISEAGIAAEEPQRGTTSSFLLRSNDGGRNWDLAGTIARLEPGRPFDGGLVSCSGFNETALVETPSGDLLAVIRHGNCQLLWSARSTDGGVTWSEIVPTNHAGVAPHMVLLESGILVGAWGRPGVRLAFSMDGEGQRWDFGTELMHEEEQSQKYAWLEAIAPDRVRIYYDRRTWDDAEEKYCGHGIYQRDISIKAHQ